MHTGSGQGGAEDAKQFGIETPNWPSQAAQESWIEMDEARMGSSFGNIGTSTRIGPMQEFGGLKH